MSPASQLPATWPGFSGDEGVFLVTSGDNGSPAVYFIAQNQRHSISSSDLQLEVQLNPLRPVRSANRDVVLRFVEGAPVGTAAIGLLLQSAPVASEIVAEPAVAEPEVAADTAYVLQPGDNLTRISARFGVGQSRLMAANGITNPNRIYAGLTLVIPGAEAAATAEAEAAPVAEAPAEPTTAYTVQPGDSAIKIARRFGVETDALLAANGITNPNRVYAGQTLQIPGNV